MYRELGRFAPCVLLTIGVTRCGAEPPDQATLHRATSPSPADLEIAMGRLQQLDRNVGPGGSGSVVRAVQAYLTRYGYFPNEHLARQHPRWRPIVTDGPIADICDERTALAVRQLQRHSSLAETGIVDEATRALLRLPRCGNPDS